MARKMVLVFALLVMGVPCFAQHHQTNIVEIDGSKTPEMIPDSVAYRQVFELLAPVIGETEESKNGRLAFLAKAKVHSELDQAELISVLAEHRTKFNQLVDSYNKQAEKGLATPDQFWRQVDELVATTRATLGKRLSIGGILQLDKFVQNEKRGITIHQGGAQ